MKLQLKVCGMRQPENIREVASLQPDYLGFIFYPPSKRYVKDLDAAILDTLPQQIRRVGVFVNEDLETVAGLALKYRLYALQLHGSESVEYLETLRNNKDTAHLKLIKAFGIDAGFDFEQLVPYAGLADYFLFDTLTPLHGGSGKAFDWKILEKYTLDLPYFLSGGIGPESVAAIAGLHDPRLFALDVNSRFELEPGLKDVDKLIEFRKDLTTKL